MPPVLAALLARLLPPGLYLLAAAAMLAWVDHRGFVRARTIAAQERLTTALMLTRAARESEARLADRLRAIDAGHAAQVTGIATLHETRILPTIEKEIRHETRFTDPAAGLSDGLRAALNHALGAVACTARADGTIACALSAAAADPRQ